LFLYFLLSIFVFRGPLVENDPQYFSSTGDLAIPITTENLLSDYYPTWSGQFSKSNLMYLSRYSVILPFILVGDVFNVHPMSIIEIFWVFTGALAGFSCYILVYFLLSKDYDVKKNYIYIASFISGLFFLFNPYFANESRHMLMRFEHAVLPLVFYSFLRVYEKKEKYLKNIFIASIVWVIYSSGVRETLYGSLVVFVCIIYLVIKYKLSLNFIIKRTTFLIIAFTLLSQFFTLPYILSLTKSQGIDLGYTVSEDMVNSLQTPFSIYNVLFFKMPNPFLPNTPYAFFPEASYIKGLSMFLPIFSSVLLVTVLYSILVRGTFTTTYFAFLLLIFISVLAVKYTVLWKHYLWLTLYSPISSQTGWILRRTYYFFPYYMLCISILLGFSIYRILLISNKSKFGGPIALSIIAINLLSIFIVSWPLLSGDFNGELKPVKIPEEYFEVNKWLYNRKEDFKVVWFPKYHVFDTTWRKNQLTKWIDDLSTSKPTFFVSKSGAKRTEHSYFFEFISSIHYRWGDDVLLAHRTNNLGRVLCPLNVRFLLFHDDIPKILNKTALNTLNSQKDLNFISKHGFVYIFENKCNGSTIYLTQLRVNIENSGLEKLLTISELTEINKVAIIFGDKEFGNNKFDKAEIFLTGNGEFNTFPENAILIEPFKQSNRHKPEKFWSLHRTWDPDGGNWRSYLIQNKISNWDFDYGKGIIFTWNPKAKQKISFKIKKTEYYKLSARFFKNQKGGEIKIYIDGKPIKIQTKDQLNKFVWKELGTFYLEKGEHEIVLENVKGFNAVNVFVLIPEKEYYKSKKEIEKLLQSKTIIYLFEGESDLYKTKAKIIKDINFSNGEALQLDKSGKAWQNIDILKKGSYRLAIKGEGKFEVKIGSKKYKLVANQSNFAYTPLFPLKKGDYKVEIFSLSENAKLDVVWIYSTETNQTLKQLFEVKEEPAEIINYTRIDPTLWKVKINSTKPFMLSFAESYDPLWEARVYKNGEKVETVKSIPLYSVINGFWINETGDLEIVIRYKPQDWFEMGLMISGLTFTGCIGYLFYDWRREKGDMWTKRIERWLNKILSKFKARRS